jgi:hypothetical protein
MYEWMLGGALIAPGFYRLLQWSTRPDRRSPWGPRATKSGTAVANGLPPETSTIPANPDKPAPRQSGASPAEDGKSVGAPE